MNSNTELINKFYSSFRKLDHAGMNRCYSPDIAFFDPMFEILKGDEVRFMWEMLCTNAKEFTLTYSNIQELDGEYCTCDWEATYVFSKTGRKVVNKVKAYMRFADGRIIEHSDAFSIHKWSGQALGITGELFGWNSFFQRRIKNQARRSLLRFIEAKKL